jgi:hypothetical protein
MPGRQPGGCRDGRAILALRFSECSNPAQAKPQSQYRAFTAFSALIRAIATATRPWISPMR